MRIVEASDYGPAVAQLLGEQRLAPLDAGHPNIAVRDLLARLRPDTLFAPHVVRDSSMASACLAGLWLYHDFLDEAHTISQDLHTTEGSYWHALMHRREPDFSNSKYWLRRVGNHPVFELLYLEAAKVAQDFPATPLARQRTWDAFGFVDLCERALMEGGMLESLCRQVQRVEWELLFDYCYRRALDE